MSLKNYYQIITRMLFTAALLFGIGMKAQNAFLISFPAAPQDLTVCNGSSKLTVQLDATIASTTGADVTIQLATGVNYVPGSVALVSTIGGLSISDNGGTANAPKFKIGPATIAPGNRIIFTIDRIATCAARTFALASGIFTDSVTASIGAQSDTKVSSSYQVIYPDLTFVQPVAQANAVVGGTYTRTFTIKNGGNGCMSQVYLSIGYPGSGIQQTSLQITAQNGSAIAPITLTPTSISGTTSYYTIPSADLPGGDLCNNENITITETYKVKACNAVTNYSAGWGCDPAPANWCQTKTGTGNITMVSGVPDFSSTGGGFLPGGSMCTYKEYSYTFNSVGTGNSTAAGYYNLILHNSNRGNFTASGINGGFDNDPATRFASYSDVTVQGVPVTISWLGPLNDQQMIIDLSQITSDPDGPGVGLEDLDGDGQFDDMLAGATITIKVRVNWYDNPNFVCNTTTGVNSGILYNPAVRPEYTTMCDPSTRILPSQTKLCVGAPYYYPLQPNNHTSIVSPNASPGTPFTAQINWYPNMGYPYTANTRWRLVFTLPSGFSVSGSGNPTINGLATTYTQVGNEVTMLTSFAGTKTFAINFVYACGSDGTKTIPYRIELVDDITAPCEYFKNRVCDTFSLYVQGCPGSGPCPGPVTQLPEVRRADNSLGYTDSTLTTRVSASSISSFDLKHALYLDTVQITTKATQNGAASNLFAKVKLDKTTNGLDKLTPIDATVEVYRGGSLINTCTLTTWSTANSTATVSEFEWDLTGCFVGGIQDQDEVRMVSRYVVSNNDDLPNASYVLVSGGKHYFYNKVAGSEVYCSGNWALDLYLLGIHYNKYANSTTDFSGCETKAVGTRFYSSYTGSEVFLNEIRPGLFVEKYDVTIPTGFVFNKFDIISEGTLYAVNASKFNIAPTSVSGNVYTFVNDGTWPIAKVKNSVQSVIPTVYVSPDCNTPLNQSAYTGNIIATGQESYYAYNVPNPGISTNTTHPFSGAVTYYGADRNNISTRARLISKPSISLSNQSGTIQASKLTESFTVRISSTGTVTAPYIWLAIPTVSGVTITDVNDGTTSFPLITYSGGVWAKLSAAGLASGSYKDYRIVFSYTTCNSTSFAVNAGWNCTGYPTDPGAYPCTPSTANLTFVPQTASIQINTITQPAGSINLCTPLNYEFRVNCSAAGNTINNKFNINLPAGLSFVPGSLLVEYPVGAGNWQALSSTTASGITTLDLTTHTAYPAQGLPGTLNDGGNANVRQMGVRFSLTTDCSFTSGAYVIVSTDADKTCGQPATGSGSLLNTSTLTVAGADPGYVLNSSVTNPNAPIVGCAGNLTLHIKQIVILSTATGTPATATVTVNYPPGYDIANTTPNCFPTTIYCPTFVASGTNPLTGLGYATYSIPVGMQTSDFLEYELTFQPNATIDNGTYQAVVTTDDVITGLSCPSAPGGVCSSVHTRTSTGIYDYTLQCYCYKNAVTSGTVLDTKHGITSLGRAGTANGNWPMVRKGAWTALEAKTKGFVVNRLTDAQIAAIPAAQLVEGMMVYNITQDCLQINVDGTAAGWKCFNTQTCPDY